MSEHADLEASRPPSGISGDVREAFEQAHKGYQLDVRRTARSTRLLRAGSVLGALLLWVLLAYLNDRVEWVNPVLLPTPWEVLLAGKEQVDRGFLFEDIVASLTRVGLGFLLAVVLGLVTGGMAGWNRNAANFLEPLIELLRPIPPLAFLPLFIMWFGLGEQSKVLFVAFVAYFTIYLNTMDAVRGVDPIYVRAAESLGARGRHMYFRIVLPGALPQIVTGIRLGFGMAFFALVAAELIAAASGLGYRIQDARTFFRVDVMLFASATIGVIGFSINSLLRALEGYALRWMPKRHAD